ncbi:MAG: hypothetical protein SWX82_16285 [Cyanobacteriota bacterium]|nr:hypothetical protein [Cyanobacteriota bacterium]
MNKRKVFLYYPLKRGGFKPQFSVREWGSGGVAHRDYGTDTRIGQEGPGVGE